MNRIELAQRRYADIVGEELPAMAPGARYGRMPTSKILTWVNEYVLPAIEEVYRRPAFREHATWPQRRLVPGALGPERAAVQRVDKALVTAAKALLRVGRNTLVAGALKGTNPSPPGRSVATVTISSEEDAARPRRVVGAPPIAHDIAKLKAMSRKDWTDLVCSDDYFVPTGFHQRT